MRAKAIVALSFACNLVVLFIGCSGAQTDAETSAKDMVYGLVRQGEPCIHDVDCRSGFCNRNRCGAVAGLYGDQCDPPTLDAPPIDKLPERLCGPFLCMDGRCRSCRSDAECQSYFGMGKCTPVPSADRPGYAECRPYTTRHAMGACVKDDECKSLFCDRGHCAGIGQLSFAKYGDRCMPSRPFPPPLDLRATGPKFPCQGYLCTDNRCRSCESNEECQKGGDTQLKCLPFLDWPGRVCVTEQEVARHPIPVIVSSPGPVRYSEDDDDPRPPPPKLRPPTPPPLCRSSLPPLPPPPDMLAYYFPPETSLMPRSDGDGGTCLYNYVPHRFAGVRAGDLSGCPSSLPPAPPPPEAYRYYMTPGTLLVRPDGDGGACLYKYRGDWPPCPSSLPPAPPPPEVYRHYVLPGTLTTRPDGDGGTCIYRYDPSPPPKP
jgi:hypothetical protein